MLGAVPFFCYGIIHVFHPPCEVTASSRSGDHICLHSRLAGYITVDGCARAHVAVMLPNATAPDQNVALL